MSTTYTNVASQTEMSGLLKMPGLYRYGPGQNLIQLLFDHLLSISDPEKRARHTILLPTSRACRALKLRLLRTSETLGNADQKGMLLPRILSLTELPEFFPHISNKTLSELETYGVIYQLLKNLDGKANHQGLQQNNLAQVRSLQKVMGELLAFKVPLEAFENCVPQELAEHAELSLSLLKDLYQNYQEWLFQENRLDPAQSLNLALISFGELLDKSTSTPSGPLIFGGLDGYLPEIETVLLKAAKRQDTLILIPSATFVPLEKESLNETHPDSLSFKLTQRLGKTPYDLQQRVQRTSCDLAGFFADLFENQVRFIQKCPAAILPLSVDSAAEEARLAALIAYEHLKDADTTVRLICPDEGLSLKIQEELKFWDIEVDLAMGRPLITSAPGQTYLRFEACLKAPENLAALFDFVSIKAFKDDEIIKKVRQARDDYRQQKTAQLATQEAVLAFQNQLWALKKAGDSISFFKNLFLYLEALLSEETFATLKTSLETLCNQSSLLNDLPFLQKLELVRDLLTQNTQRNPKSHARLALIAPLQAPYVDAKVSILCGLREGLWPARQSPSPYLNRQMRKTLGLPDHQSLIGRAALLFCMSFSPQKTYLLSSKRGESEPFTPSRWLRRLQTHFDLLPQHKEDNKTYLEKLKFLREPAKLPALKRSSWQQFKTLPRYLKLSIKDLIWYQTNPYDFFARKGLGLYPTQNPSEPDYASTYGSWIHKILEEAAQKKITAHQELVLLGERFLPESLPKAQKNEYRLSLESKALYLEKLLKDLGYEVLETRTEHKLSHTLCFGAHQVEIYGIADRIDYFANQRVRIIDYKTGSIPSIKSVTSLETPQLPLLAWLFCKQHQEEHGRDPKITAAFVDLKGEKILFPDVGGLQQECDNRVRQLCQEILQQNRSFDLNIEGALSRIQDPYRLLNRVEELLAQSSAESLQTSFVEGDV